VDHPLHADDGIAGEAFPERVRFAARVDVCCAGPERGATRLGVHGVERSARRERGAARRERGPERGPEHERGYAAAPDAPAAASAGRGRSVLRGCLVLQLQVAPEPADPVPGMWFWAM